MELLENVKEFCMSQDFEKQFDDFASEHANVFLPAVTMEAGTEHQLEFMECFQKYLDYFEDKIKRFIEDDLNSSVATFFSQCRRALEELPEFHPNKFFIEGLLATAEYEVFFRLMVGEVRKYHPDFAPSKPSIDDDRRQEEKG